MENPDSSQKYELPLDSGHSQPASAVSIENYVDENP